MLATRAALFGVTLLAAATTAYAHGEGAVLGPLVIVAALFGLVGGVVTGAKGRGSGVGLAISFGSLTITVLVMAVFAVWELGAFEFFGVIVMGLIALAYAGAIPFAVTYFAAFKFSAFIRTRAGVNAKDANSAP